MADDGAFNTDVASGRVEADAVAGGIIALMMIPRAFVLLRNAGWSNTKAFLANAGSSLSSLLGGALGYFALSTADFVLPYVLVIAASSFIYVALADIFPLLHKQRDSFVRQSLLIGAGVAVVPLVGWFTH